MKTLLLVLAICALQTAFAQSCELQVYNQNHWTDGKSFESNTLKRLANKKGWTITDKASDAQATIEISSIEFSNERRAKVLRFIERKTVTINAELKIIESNEYYDLSTAKTYNDLPEGFDENDRGYNYCYSGMYIGISKRLEKSILKKAINKLAKCQK